MNSELENLIVCLNRMRFISESNEEIEKIRSDIKDIEEDSFEDGDTMAYFPAAIGLFVIIIMLAYKIHWIIAVLSGGATGCILDFPFKIFRLRKFRKKKKERIDSLNSEIQKKSLGVSQALSSSEYVGVRAVVSERNMTVDCISFMISAISGGQASTIQQAFGLYLGHDQARGEAHKSYREKSGGVSDTSQTGFFVGCDSVEKLNARYKQLAKCYHPDTGIGDEETMKRINTEYNRMKEILAR